MANEEHVKWLLEGVDAWNERRQSDYFRPDLSNLNVRNEFKAAGLLEQDGGVRLSRIRLENARLLGADLSHVYLYDAKLNGADLTLANLKGAQLDGADLTNANLHAAKIRGANLENAVLTGTNLTRTKPWETVLYPPMDTMYRSLPDLEGHREIGCLENLLEVCRKIRLHYYSSDGRPKDVRLPCNGLELRRYEREGPFVENMRFYFRGERCSCTSWGLRPSLLRSETSPGPRDYEGEMLLDLMARRPEEFGEVTSAVEQWVLAQHHGLQTRLVDVTRNPLVALFNACQDCTTCDDGDGEARPGNRDGRLHIIAVPKTMVKPFNSDTVSVVANFGKLSRAEQDLLLGKGLEETEGSKDSGSRDLVWDKAMRRLYHFIRQEKPSFGERIDPRHLFEVFVVEPRQLFERVRAQSGAFLISAFHERFEREEISKRTPSIPIYDHHVFRVSSGWTSGSEIKPKKQTMLDDLRLLNITRESLYPGLQESASAVIEQYTNL